MRLFWILYAAMAVVTAARAAYGMHKVRDKFTAEVEHPNTQGIFYVAMFVSLLTMGLCWWLYWPALGAVMLADRKNKRNDSD